MDTAFATGLYDFKRLNMISNDPKYVSMKSFGRDHNSFLILDSWKKLRKQKILLLGILKESGIFLFK